jgi:predicted dehydrogenase
VTRLRFGIVGCGRMGERRARSAEAAGAEITAVTDAAPERARTLAAKHTSAAEMKSWQELVTSSRVDLVVISTPNALHRPIAEAALAAGKHVFCEKPLAGTTEDARAIVEAARRAERVLKVGSNLRFFPNVKEAKRLLDAGEIGDPLFLRCWIGHDGWNVAGDASWFKDPKQAGGGTFLDNGCHVLDIARWFMGEVVRCTGMVQTAHWPIAPLEDNAFGIFSTATGRTICIQASWTEWNGYMFLEIYGDRGYLRVDSRGKSCSVALGRRGEPEKLFDYSHLPPRSYDDEMADLLAAIASGRTPEPDGFAGQRAVEMAHAVYAAAREGRHVDLEPR